MLQSDKTIIWENRILAISAVTAALSIDSTKVDVTIHAITIATHVTILTS